jgi:hypothetical protein
MWSREEVDKGVLDTINAEEAFSIFERHSNELFKT